MAMGSIPYELERFLQDGINPEHGQQLLRAQYSNSGGFGYRYRIADSRSYSIYEYAFEGCGYSGWRLVNVEHRAEMGNYYMGVDTGYMDSFAGAVVLGKPKEKAKEKPPKVSKQIRHTYLRKILLERNK